MKPTETNLATRLAYAQVLRRFLAGRLTTDQYEDATFDLLDGGRDSAVDHIFAACWHLYDDIIPHRMTGERRVEGELRRRAARWILFLRSGAGYEGCGLPPRHPERPRAGRARLGNVAFALALLALIGGAAASFWWTGLGAIFVASVLLTGLIAGFFGEGVSLNADAAARAFADVGDPWPFASADDLTRAIASRTYLCGRVRPSM